MCTYCVMGDWMYKYWPPAPTPVVPPLWPTGPTPAFPAPLPTAPQQPWSLEQLAEMLDILKRVREMEEKLGICPCERDDKKPDYIGDLQRRLDALEKKERDSRV